MAGGGDGGNDKKNDTKNSAPPIGIAGGEHSLLWYPKRNEISGTTSSLFSTGACGLGWCRNLPLHRDLFQFRPVMPSKIPSFQMVYPSYYHNLAVDAKNTLYTWGCGTFIEGGMDGVIPALGPGRTQDSGQDPQPVQFPSSFQSDRILQVAGGAYHSIVLLESGSILTFGAGQLGQLGRPLQFKDASGLPVDPNPRPVQGLFDDNNNTTRSDKKVQSIGSSFYNTFAVTNNGELFCSGENQNEQCGILPKNLHRMTRVLEVRDVEQVDGGYCHTLVKTLQGHVDAMGCGDDGQRGDGMLETDDEHPDDGPQRAVVNRLAVGTLVKQVAAGANHSVLLGENGVAFTFGANDVGQCGIISPEGKEGDPVVSPQPVVLPENEVVTHVSAGYAHTILTTRSGNVYAFGQNDNGQLGVGADDFGQGKEPEPRRKPIRIPLKT